MKRLNQIIHFFLVFIILNILVNSQTEDKKMIDSIKWLGHSSFKIKQDKVIYIDPFNISETEPADIILISHIHHDHLSIDDIKKIQAKKTIIVTTADCAKQLTGNIKILTPGETIEVDGIKIEGIAAYNPNKKFHPKENKWLGFVININNERIYYAGDTDMTDEMKALKNIDIAILPIGGTYTMNAKEAAEAANTFKPKIVIPCHYGSVVGNKNDAIKFKELYNGKTEILEKSK